MRIVIVGGVAGGMSAAARARRLDESAEIIVLERGPYVSFANCGLPYFIGGEITDRAKLLIASPQLFHDRFRVEVRRGGSDSTTVVDRDGTVRQGTDARLFALSRLPLMFAFVAPLRAFRRLVGLSTER
jgi:NADPH-dependent 2,4-dienoyl-CoA reductase/sulfur reductase-like enzyme